MLNRKKTTKSERLESLFRKTGNFKRAFHPKMGTIKGRNDRDLVNTEEIKRWKEYTEELFKKDVNEPDYYDSVVSHSEPDILENGS